jgi:catechol 2,3-dioxygenase-like lactoylglutathione lyase family enzyme
MRFKQIGAIMISHLQMITIYVSDLDRALDFYTGKLGFVKTAEFNDGQQRLVWVVPSGAADVDLATEIALFAPGEGDPRIGAATGIVFSAADIETTYREVKRRGVESTLEFPRHPYGQGEGDQEARFVDPDGYEFLLHTDSRQPLAVGFQFRVPSSGWRSEHPYRGAFSVVTKEEIGILRCRSHLRMLPPRYLCHLQMCPRLVAADDRQSPAVSYQRLAQAMQKVHSAF